MDYTSLKQIDELYQDTPHQNNELLPEQAEAFNTLLTAISVNVATLKNNIRKDNLPNSLGTTMAEGVSIFTMAKHYQNWILLIDHLAIELLPEIYALFHDSRQLTNNRHYLHHYILSLWQQSQSWLDNIIIKSSEFSLSKKYYSDNYVTSSGDNAKVAKSLSNIIATLDIDIDLYLKQLDMILACYTNASKLKTILSLSSVDAMEQIEQWQKQRLIAFSKLNNNETFQALETISQVSKTTSSQNLVNNHLDSKTALDDSNKHPLSSYIATDMALDDLQISRFTENNILSKQEKKDLIYELRHNYIAPLTFLALIAFLNTSFIGVFLITLASLGSSYLAYKYLRTDFQLNKVAEPYLLEWFKLATYKLTVIAVFLFVASFLIDASVIYVLLFAILSLLAMGVQYCYEQTPDGLLHKINNKEKPSIEPTEVSFSKGKTSSKGITSHVASNTKKSVEINKSASIENSNVDKSIRTQSELLPIDTNTHTYHLKIILSDSAEDILDSLVNTVNESYQSLDYLQKEHAYLATSVKELLLDIVNNSLLRLDSIAKTFVINGEVNPNAKQVFAEQYEKQVTELFCHHIEELTSLNQSIIEKQMAGFSQTGTAEELKFRDSVMELKILLRWHIAQSPNETASSHQVILKSLEDTTLKQMTDAFYATTSTAEQRQRLQSQIDSLLAHFKSRSTINDTSIDDALLQLTHGKGTSIDDLDLSHLDSKNEAYRDNLSNNGTSDNMDATHLKTKTQKFIDFNDHYINQIKKHW